MSNQITFHCIVDDTTLITNLDEIGPWVQAGTVNLVVPLYTLERLHLLKKDASQLGQSARKALKFLDQTADLSHSPVVIQGLEDQYTEWANVESHYADSIIRRDESENVVTVKETSIPNAAEERTKEGTPPEKSIKDLSLSSEDFKTSPISTPPLSPVVSEPQSNKTSPEVRSAKLAKHDATPVPPTLKSLINYVVWYTHEGQEGAADKNLIFLTNSADAAQIAKDFSVVPKTIHQLRASISTELEQPERMTPGQHKKNSGRALSFKDESEPRTLFRYDEGSSEDEELVFKPRTKELSRPGSSGRGGPNNSMRGRNAVHSPSNSVNATTAPKPQVPVEEIDPDSFDRGTFARGSTPLANVGNHYGPFTNNHNRGGQRNFSSPMPRGGGGGHRGNTFRGRGRGRLFVP